MYEDIYVVKRSGKKEKLDLEKIRKVLYWAIEGTKDTSISDIEVNAKLQFYKGIKTTEIHDILIKSAVDLISLERPDYEIVASKLLLYKLRKDVLGQFEPIPLKELIVRNKHLYDMEILSTYSEEEIDELDTYIDHSRDLNFKYAGLRQLVDKYLLKDRITGKIYETPQYAFMLISMFIFHKYPKDRRLNYIKRFYDALSKFKISLPTPIMAGVRTKLRQYASCTLLDCGDNLDSITYTTSAIIKYTASRSGIGLNVGRIRAIGSPVRDGEVIHTGLIPFLKVFEASCKSTVQNGIRGGAMTVNYPFWHYEFPELVVLKNNQGTEETRVRGVDYAIAVNKLLFERYFNDEDITLFSPHEVPDLYNAFYDNDYGKFKALYEKYEKDNSIKTKRKISAKEVVEDILRERIETGRIYLFFADNINQQKLLKKKLVMTNLCLEIVLPTEPLQSDETGELPLCILAGVNVGNIRRLKEIEEYMDLLVRALDELIDYQEYPVIQAKKTMQKYRYLGIGVIGLAHYLAKHKTNYSDTENSLPLIDDLFETIQYYGLKASNELAEEKGQCEGFTDTLYAEGILPVDRYKKTVDELYKKENYLYDWESLRKSIKEYGLRNCTITAQFPSESSSVVSGETNGVEPPRYFLVEKKDKQGVKKLIVPEYKKLKKYYETAFDMKTGNRGYLSVLAIIQKYIDQAISTNQYYDYSKYPDNKIPLSEILKDILFGYKYGIKTFYYLNTINEPEKKKENKEDKFDKVDNISVEDDGCISGACAL